MNFRTSSFTQLFTSSEEDKMKSSCGLFIALLLVISLVNGESEEETPSKEDNDKRIEDEIRFHANPGQQTRKDLKNVAGMMLEEVGLPFFSWPTFGVIKDAAKTLFGVGKSKSGKRPDEAEDYDYERASLKSKDKSGKIKTQN